MSFKHYFGFLTGVVFLIGCTKAVDKPNAGGPKAESGSARAKELDPKEEATIQTALAKLTDADRSVAKAQKFCPIEKTRLGTMGKPARIDIDGQPVFLCCSGCETEARANPKSTLEQVAKFKEEK
jgi:hypothetical protein